MGMRIAAEPPSSPMNMGCSSLTPWRPPPRRCSFPRRRSFRSRMRRRTARSPHPPRDTPTDIRRPAARILLDDGKRGPFASRRIRCKTKGRNAPKTVHSKRACNRLQLAGGRLSVTDKFYVHVHLTLRAGDKATYFLNVGPDFGVCLQARRVLKF